jgi:hypothetical protein
VQDLLREFTHKRTDWRVRTDRMTFVVNFWAVVSVLNISIPFHALEHVGLDQDMGKTWGKHFDA